eukprot:TRINITY_DN10145_c3_g1_i1.p1 TRINITY_DN10145_c3_g1~~TRINITY_DN10145_c3_g1_i1.p1  ORF type:complete len:211 (+),score=51.76 TRINITY_DN10145_c3_g1_i1:298-930(+)
MGGVEQSVREYADLGSWDKVAREIEEYDTMNYDTPTAPAVYVLGLLGYLNAGDCNGARYLYRRLPSSIQRDETVAAVADIARSLWQGDTMQAQTLLANRTWAEEFLSATKSLQERLQRQSIRVLSSAYSRISVQRVMESLGADKARAIALAAEAGLRYSEEEDAFVSAGNKAELRANRTQGVDAIHAVAETALFLEEQAVSRLGRPPPRT